MRMAKAGSAVDQVIEEVAPLLQPGDILIDGGNTHYPDTTRRTRALKARGLLYIGTGDGGGGGDQHGAHGNGQNLGTLLGKILRIDPRPSGGRAYTIPRDNPFVGREGYRPEIYSLGHRNVLGLFVHPETGELWQNENGPLGGDEINIPQAGKNYGWPVIGYGIDYDGTKIHESTQKAGMEQPIKYWVPSIAPSGMAFYTADLFPVWKDSLIVGALAGQMLVRLELDGETVTKEERLLERLGERIRDVRQGPDGALWLLTDAGNGRLLRVSPAK